MELYNSYSQKTEELKPIHEGKISMYVCGPTVYNDPHIGNARPIVVFDTLKKALQAQGLDVLYASNYTDVDDKIINAALEQGVSEHEITDRYIRSYNDVRKGLNADLPDVAPRVTETMNRIIDFIDEMVKNGSAYQVDGDVYFKVDADPYYGELSHQQVEDLKVGARIEENSKKLNPLDFTLWKETDKGIQWDSPWSKGRPGWHTECVVMIQDTFQQPTIDIHGGGQDLKFPHHENEMAQNRCVHHAKLANHWVHNGMINVDGIKMSKSLGNVKLASELIDEFGGNVVRWVMVSAHYRAPLNLSEEAFQAAINDLKKIQTACRQAQVKLQLADACVPEALDEELWNKFLAAMNDDLNTPNAIAVVHETVKKLNQLVRQRQLDPDAAGAVVKTLEKELSVLGIELDQITLSDQDKADYAAWRAAVKAKDFNTADALRAQLMARGIV